MEWQRNFFPVSVKGSFHQKAVGNVIVKNEGETLDLEKVDVVFFSVEQSTPEKSNALRAQLYNFRNADAFDSFADLGDYILTQDYDDANIDEVGFILSELFLMGKAVLVYCDQEDFMPVAIDKAFAYCKKAYSIIESNLKVASTDDFGAMDSNDWLTKNLQNEASTLYHYGLLAYQSNQIDKAQLEYLHKLGFEAERLGVLKGSIAAAEPMIRMGNALQFNANSIKASYLGAAHQYANGLNGEEACAIFKYAGANSEMNVAAFTASAWGINNIGAHQFAQMIWYFIEGVQIGFQENPLDDDTNYIKYLAHFESPSQDISFYKSRRTDKWWFYLPVDKNKYPLFKYLIPCSYADYEMAMQGEIPIKWVQAVARLDN